MSAVIAPSSPTLIGTYANRPTSAATGTTYYCTDGSVSFVYTGSAWAPDLRGKLGVQPPAIANWSAAGGALSTAVDAAGTLHLANASNGAADVMRCLLRPLPASNRVTAHVRASWTPDSFPGVSTTVFGLTFKAAGDALSNIGIAVFNDLPIVVYQTWTNSTTLSTSSGDPFLYAASSDLWLRLEYSGGNRVSSYSSNGVVWTTIESAAAGLVPASVGVFINPTRTATSLIVDSWDET